MRRTLLLLAVSVLVLASCGGGGDGEGTRTASPLASASAPTATVSPSASLTAEISLDYEIPPFDEMAAMFDYDTSEPLGYEVLDERQEGSATVYDVNYQSSGYAVPGWLVIPNGQGPFPVVLYAHGGSGSRSWFLEDALALAREGGYAGLLTDSPANREPYLPIGTTGDARLDIEGQVQWVRDFRRGIDLLETLPEIDADRIGFVGCSAGAWMGPYLSGVDDRIDAYVLVSGGQFYPCSPVGGSGSSCHVTDGFKLFSGIRGWTPTPQELERYLSRTMVLNSVPYVSHNESAAFLIQMGKADPAASRSTVRAFLRSRPGTEDPQVVRGHPRVV